jgi:hypothetical protein
MQMQDGLISAREQYGLARYKHANLLARLMQ